METEEAGLGYDDFRDHSNVEDSLTVKNIKLLLEIISDPNRKKLAYLMTRKPVSELKPSKRNDFMPKLRREFVSEVTPSFFLEFKEDLENGFVKFVNDIGLPSEQKEDLISVFFSRIEAITNGLANINQLNEENMGRNFVLGIRDNYSQINTAVKEIFTILRHLEKEDDNDNPAAPEFKFGSN